MRPAHDLEQAVGMLYYASEGPGTGGRLRDRPEDFRVVELEQFDTHPVDADVDDYPWLVLRVTLTDTDTNDFARQLSNAIGISRERVTWAGTKDKRAVTTQLFSVRAIGPEDVPPLESAEIEVVGRAGRGLQFGDLLGNEFEIVVREADQPERAESIAAELAERFDGGGVPNFFGQQRFGSYRPVTHRVGFEIIRGNWGEAAMAYLGNPSEHEPSRTSEARSFVEETRDWKAALDRFPGHLSYERAMLHTLVERDGTDPEDFRAALETFPGNVQRLFVHAAQSAAFNWILSERLERGLPFDVPVVGDVVCFADSDAPDGLPLADTDRCQAVTEGRLEVIRRHCERDRAFVTAPLLGTDTTPSEGEPGAIERVVLGDLGLEPSDFDLPGEFHSAGHRRPIFLAVTPEITFDPLTFEFALPKGSYATVVMREFTKANPLEL
ncbi:MAG: tRNA pseudouridine(13) synthase TruD [Halodesulfurarchaeum sp.]